MVRSITCPICNRTLPPQTAESNSKWLPFCSERCRNVDLYRWSTGRYAIVEPLTDDADVEAGTMNDPHEDEA